MKTESEIVALLDTVGSLEDPLADDVVRQLIENGELGRAHQLFRQLVDNSTPLPTDAPPLAGQFFEQSAALPPWFDLKLVTRGENTYSDFGPECLVLLLFKSLPQGYSMWHIAKTLHITGKLTAADDHLKALQRRILETLQFVVNVMGPDGFSDKGRARVTTQKVRMIHGTIRTKIVDTDQWNADWKAPVNQEELLMTMLTFSLEVIDGLNQLGIQLHADDQEGVLHLWKVVAYILGMHDELQPANLKEARLMWSVIVRRNRTETTAEGADLAESVVLYGKSILPTFLDFLPRLMLFHFNDAKVRKMLSIKRPHLLLLALFVPLRGALLALQSLRHFSPLSRILFRRFHLMLLKGLIAHWNRNQPVTFTIPDTLQGAWNLQKFCENQGMGSGVCERPPEPA